MFVHWSFGVFLSRCVLDQSITDVNTIIDLRKAHSEGKSHFGVNVYEGGVADMSKSRVLEPSRVVEQAIQSASETAVMILRIDDVISSRGASPGGAGEFDGLDM